MVTTSNVVLNNPPQVVDSISFSRPSELDGSKLATIQGDSRVSEVKGDSFSLNENKLQNQRVISQSYAIKEESNLGGANVKELKGSETVWPDFTKQDNAYKQDSPYKANTYQEETTFKQENNNQDYTYKQETTSYNQDYTYNQETSSKNANLYGQENTGGLSDISRPVPQSFGYGESIVVEDSPKFSVGADGKSSP